MATSVLSALDPGGVQWSHHWVRMGCLNTVLLRRSPLSGQQEGGSGHGGCSDQT
jgi:hypothetical protein